jgi:hypothetical protein
MAKLFSQLYISQVLCYSRYETPSQRCISLHVLECHLNEEQQFDRLLFLAKGGKTVYFGEIGEQSRALLDYFESNGARVCGSSENVRL